jgi:uncharacterized protein HemY
VQVQVLAMADLLGEKRMMKMNVKGLLMQAVLMVAVLYLLCSS